MSTLRYALLAVALKAWAAEPDASAPGNSEFTLKLYAAWLLAPDEVRALVLAKREQAQAKLDHYEQVWAHLPEDLPFTDPRAADRATVRIGLGYERHRVDWANWMLAELERLEG